MSDYNIQVSWSGKDALADSDPDKVISGGDFNTEFTAVKTALNSKSNLNGNSGEDFDATTQAASNNTNKVATTAFVTTATSAAKIADVVYPVGSIILGVWARAIAERGEDGGSLSDMAQLQYSQALADSIAQDAGRHTSEVTWNAV